MSEDLENIDEAAARWLIAQNSDATDWDGFTAWLEADPRHREAFDAIALLDDKVDAALPTLRRLATPEPEVEAPKRRPFRWAIGGTAVAAAVALGLVLLPGAPVPAPVEYRTAQGQVREVQLADGSSATLAPGSVISASARRSEPLTLDGSAHFDVRHDPASPLTIRAGGYEIRDIGTRFEVSTNGGILRVAVSEGKVSVRSLSAQGFVEVLAGQVLTALDPRQAPTLTPLRPTAASGWKTGRLVYDDVPLGLVVADIQRGTGQPVAIDPAIAKRRFSGVLATGTRDQMVAALSELTGLTKRTERDAIRLGDGAGR